MIATSTRALACFFSLTYCNMQQEIPCISRGNQRFLRAPRVRESGFIENNQPQVLATAFADHGNETKSAF
jgi:hypothetical protein